LLLFAASTSCSWAAGGPLAVLDSDGGTTLLPTGQVITPTLAPGSAYQRLATGLPQDGNADADSAMSSAISPDRSTLLVLTSGFNTGINFQDGGHSPILFPALDPLTGKPSALTPPGLSNGYNQSEFVFVYDLSSGYAVKIQKVEIPDTYDGIAWDPAGGRFYGSGGIDDRILVYKNGVARPRVAYVPDAPFIILNHNANGTLPVPSYHGAGLANTPAAHGPYAALVTAITPAATV
jgi:hypothetical protein